MAFVDDGKAQALFTQIDASRRSGNFRRMRDLSLELVALDPEQPSGHLYAGQAAIGLKDYKEAEPRLRKALSLSPKSDFAHYLLAVAYRESGRHPQAEEEIHKALEFDPRNADYWSELAILCHAQGDLVGTRRYAQKALEIDPEHATAVNLLGMAEPRDTPKGPKEAIKTYLRALEIDPEDAAVHNNIGVAYLELKDYARAEESFRTALSLDPQEKLFRKNLYLVLKHRSPLYRLLNLPGDLALQATSYVADHYWVLFLILAVPMALLRASTRSGWFRPTVVLLAPLALFVVWFLVFKPLIFCYEFLTVSDVRTRAREVGARQGGVLGVHGWPFWVRYACFFGLLCAVWTALGFAVASPVLRPWVLGVVGTGMVGFILYGGFLSWQEKRREGDASRRRLRFLRARKT
jgi:tetratricopeptide (TPR) repeat protein